MDGDWRAVRIGADFVTAYATSNPNTFGRVLYGD
jgi:hypothetical protein